MSKRMMTATILSKLKALIFTLTFTFITLICVTKYTEQKNVHIQLLSSCMTLESKLPMNHVNHPCRGNHQSNNNWLSWLSGDTKSTHVHFLDLIELINYNFN